MTNLSIFVAGDIKSCKELYEFNPNLPNGRYNFPNFQVWHLKRLDFEDCMIIWTKTH